MKKYRIPLLIAAIAALCVVHVATTKGQTVPTLDPFKTVSTSTITPRNPSSTLQIPSLPNAPCVKTNASGTFQSTNCGTGGGGSSSTYTVVGGTGITTSVATSTTNSTTTVTLNINGGSLQTCTSGTLANSLSGVGVITCQIAVQSIGGVNTSTISIIGAGGTSIATTTNSITFTSVSTSTANQWTALQTFTKGITANGTTTLASTTSALLLTDSSGVVAGFAGSTCSAGNAPRGVSATGTVQNCTAYLTGNQSVTLTISGDATGTAAGATSISDSIQVTGLLGKALPSLATGTLQYVNGAWTLSTPLAYTVAAGTGLTASVATSTTNTTTTLTLNINGGSTQTCSGVNFVNALSATGTIACGTPTTGGGTVGPSTSTYVAVFNASGTVVGYANLTYTSSTETLLFNASGTIADSSNGRIRLDGTGNLELADSQINIKPGTSVGFRIFDPTSGALISIDSSLLTSNRAYQFPNASGVLCITTTCIAQALQSLNGATSSAQTVVGGTNITVSTAASSTNSTTTVSLSGVVGTANGGTGTSTTPANNAIIIGNGGSYVFATLPDCTSAQTPHYTSSTKAWSCQTDAGGSSSTPKLPTIVVAASGGDATDIPSAYTLANNTSTYPDGATIFLTDLSYTIPATTTIWVKNNNITLRGNFGGTNINWAAPSKLKALFTASGTAISGMNLEDLIFTGTSSTYAGVVVDASNVGTSLIWNVLSSGFQKTIKANDTLNATFYNMWGNIQSYDNWCVDASSTNPINDLTLINFRCAPNEDGLAVDTAAGRVYGYYFNNGGQQVNLYNANAEPANATGTVGLGLYGGSNLSDMNIYGLYAEANATSVDIGAGVTRINFFGGQECCHTHAGFVNAGTDITKLGFDEDFAGASNLLPNLQVSGLMAANTLNVSSTATLKAGVTVTGGGITQSGGVNSLASTTVNGNATTTALTITGIASGNCLHTGTGGVVTGTGSDCGSGGGSGTVSAATTTYLGVYTASTTVGGFSNISYTSSSKQFVIQNGSSSITHDVSTSTPSFFVDVQNQTGTRFFAVASTSLVYMTGSSTAVTIGGGSLAAGACTSTTIVFNAPLSTSTDQAFATPQIDPGDSTFWKANISATTATTGTVTVKVCEAVLGTPTASKYNVSVWRNIGN